jgi:zinc transport system substrate-binding protein
MTRRSLLVLAATALAALGCERTPAPPTAAARPLVVASFFTLWDFSRQVAGERAEVISLVPPGVEPHDWEPTPQDVVQVRKARLFVYNGAGFEQAADRLLKEIAGAGPLAVNVTAGIPLLEAPGEARGPRDKDHPRDPHVWLDPVLAQAQVDAITAGLVQADPEGRAGYAERAAAYEAKLAALHGDFEVGLRECVRRDVVTSHTAFTYLARRYRLNQVPVLGIAPESEPSPADLARLVRFARKAGVRYIFFETLVSPKLAETLAREVGARTLVLNPIEGLTKDEQAAGKGYIELMEDNLTNLRTALGCA